MFQKVAVIEVGEEVERGDGERGGKGQGDVSARREPAMNAIARSRKKNQRVINAR